MAQGRKAVVDVGSNSVLLLIEAQENGSWTPVAERTWITSLGEGTRQTGLLSEQGMSRTLSALREAFETASELGSEAPVAAATMAARIAGNTPEFLDRAQAQGTPVIVLSGEDEARLGFEAVAFDPAFAQQERLTVVDVGGQSTEITTADHREGWNVSFRRSFPIGTLALKGEVLRDECPQPGALLEAAVFIDGAIGVRYSKGECGTPVALGATPTNLASIKLALSSWDPEKVHGMWLDFGDVGRAAGMLMSMTEAQRREVVGIEKGREATLPAGALILERCLQVVAAPGCYVSVRGWRHALLERG